MTQNGCESPHHVGVGAGCRSGKTNRNAECTPGYYNFEGQFNRRQDGNYNGGFAAYCDHIARIEAEMDADFTFTRG